MKIYESFGLKGDDLKAIKDKIINDIVRFVPIFEAQNINGFHSVLGYLKICALLKKAFKLGEAIYTHDYDANQIFDENTTTLIQNFLSEQPQPNLNANKKCWTYEEDYIFFEYGKFSGALDPLLTEGFLKFYKDCLNSLRMPEAFDKSESAKYIKTIIQRHRSKSQTLLNELTQPEPSNPKAFENAEICLCAGLFILSWHRNRSALVRSKAASALIRFDRKSFLKTSFESMTDSLKFIYEETLKKICTLVAQLHEAIWRRFQDFHTHYNPYIMGPYSSEYRKTIVDQYFVGIYGPDAPPIGSIRWALISLFKQMEGIETKARRGNLGSSWYKNYTRFQFSLPSPQDTLQMNRYLETHQFGYTSEWLTFNTFGISKSKLANEGLQVAVKLILSASVSGGIGVPQTFALILFSWGLKGFIAEVKETNRSVSSTQKRILFGDVDSLYAYLVKAKDQEHLNYIFYTSQAAYHTVLAGASVFNPKTKTFKNTLPKSLMKSFLGIDYYLNELSHSKFCYIFHGPAWQKGITDMLFELGCGSNENISFAQKCLLYVLEEQLDSDFTGVHPPFKVDGSVVTSAGDSKRREWHSSQKIIAQDIHVRIPRIIEELKNSLQTNQVLKNAIGNTSDEIKDSIFPEELITSLAQFWSWSLVELGGDEIKPMDDMKLKPGLSRGYSSAAPSRKSYLTLLLKQATGLSEDVIKGKSGFFEFAEGIISSGVTAALSEVYENQIPKAFGEYRPAPLDEARKELGKSKAPLYPDWKPDFDLIEKAAEKLLEHPETIVANPSSLEIATDKVLDPFVSQLTEKIKPRIDKARFKKSINRIGGGLNFVRKLALFGFGVMKDTGSIAKAAGHSFGTVFKDVSSYGSLSGGGISIAVGFVGSALEKWLVSREDALRKERFNKIIKISEDPQGVLKLQYSAKEDGVFEDLTHFTQMNPFHINFLLVEIGRYMRHIISTNFVVEIQLLCVLKNMFEEVIRNIEINKKAISGPHSDYDDSTLSQSPHAWAIERACLQIQEDPKFKKFIKKHPVLKSGFDLKTLYITFMCQFFKTSEWFSDVQVYHEFVSFSMSYSRGLMTSKFNSYREIFALLANQPSQILQQQSSKSTASPPRVASGGALDAEEILHNAAGNLFRKQSIDPSGNCLILAVLYDLNLKNLIGPILTRLRIPQIEGVINPHESNSVRVQVLALRRLAAQYLIEHQAEYAGFVLPDEFQAQCQRITVWNEYDFNLYDLVPSILSIILRVGIMIYTRSPGNPQLIETVDERYFGRQYPNTLRLLFVGRNHYEVLVALGAAHAEADRLPALDFPPPAGPDVPIAHPVFGPGLPPGMPGPQPPMEMFSEMGQQRLMEAEELEIKALLGDGSLSLDALVKRMLTTHRPAALPPLLSNPHICPLNRDGPHAWEYMTERPGYMKCRFCGMQSLMQVQAG